MTDANPFRFLFGKKKHKTASDGERHPLNIPEIPEAKFNAIDITEFLQNGAAVWAWYDMLKKYNASALENFVGNATDTFAMYRVEGKYLVKYIAIVKDKKFVLKLSEVRKMCPSAVMDLYNVNLKDAYKVFYDAEGLSENLDAFVHDVTEEMIDKELQTRQVMYVSDDHFKTREAATAE